jgi:acyl carrier protein
LVYKKLVKILSEIIGSDDEDITPETELTVDNGIEAIDVAKLVIECEQCFKITIHDEDVHTFKKVGDIEEYIKKIKSDI